MSKMYTVRDVAGKLQLHTETIKRYIYNKDIRAYKVSGQWRIKAEDLKEFIEKETNMEG